MLVGSSWIVEVNAVQVMEFKDYYQILGVDPDADDKAIKTAYRRLARKYHPDVSAEENAEQQFKMDPSALPAISAPSGVMVVPSFAASSEGTAARTFVAINDSAKAPICTVVLFMLFLRIVVFVFRIGSGLHWR